MNKKFILISHHRIFMIIKTNFISINREVYRQMVYKVKEEVSSILKISLIIRNQPQEMIFCHLVVEKFKLTNNKITSKVINSKIIINIRNQMNQEVNHT